MLRAPAGWPSSSDREPAGPHAQPTTPHPQGPPGATDRPGRRPDGPLSAHHRPVRLLFGRVQFHHGRPAEGLRPGAGDHHAGQLGLVDPREPPAGDLRPPLRLGDPGTAAALRDPTDPPGKPVLRPPVLSHHHHLEQRPGAVHRDAGRRGTDLHHRSALLSLAVQASLGVPRLPHPDPVRGVADLAADPAAPDHPGKLPVVAGHRRRAVLPQPARDLPATALVARLPASRPDPGGGPGRMVRPHLGTAGHPVADRSGGEQPVRRPEPHARRQPGAGRRRPVAQPGPVRLYRDQRAARPRRAHLSRVDVQREGVRPHRPGYPRRPQGGLPGLDPQAELPRRPGRPLAGEGTHRGRTDDRHPALRRHPGTSKPGDLRRRTSSTRRWRR